MKLEITDSHIVKDYECDKNSLMKLSTLFNLFQHSSQKLSEDLKIDWRSLQAVNLAWIIRNYDIDVDEMPKGQDSLQVLTAIKSVRRCSIFFQQDVLDMDSKKKLLSSVSQFVLINSAKGLPAPIKTNIKALTDFGDHYVYEKIEDTKGDTQENQKIAFDQIDFNNHLNNSYYPVFAYNALPFSFLDKNQLKRIQVSYQKSAHKDDTLSIHSDIKYPYTAHKITSAVDPSVEFARLKFTWRSR